MTSNPLAGPVTVAILAGGQSRRMGSDKARMVVGRDDAVATPLIAGVARSVAPIAARIVVVGGDADLADVVCDELADVHADLAVEWIRDQWPEEGPLGGVITALERATAVEPDGRLLTVSCDLVGLEHGLLVDLVNESVQGNGDVCVPMVDGERQWHVAVWSLRSMTALGNAFASGERSIRRGASGLRQIVHISSAASRFCDLDTPEDVDAHNNAN